MEVPKIRVSLVEVPISKIKANPWNPNEQTDFIFEKERRSIRTHGFMQPILVRTVGNYFQVIDGEHRWKAAKEEGMKKIPANNLGKVKDSVAKQLTIIMNETRGQARRDKLGSLLKGLALEVDIEELYLDLPYEQIEIDSLMNTSEIQWEGLDKPVKNESEEGFKTVSFRLPESIAEQLNQMIDRVKKQLNPETSPDEQSYVQAIEAICQIVSQIPDNQLL